MKRRINRYLGILSFFAVWFSLSVSGFAQRIEPNVEEFMRTAIERSHFQGSILIARDGKVLVSKGYGMANAEHAVPNSPHTKFRIGSLSKQFTALAILMLQEQGRLNVQDPMCKYLPQCPESWQRISIHHLLTHTSGIQDIDYIQARIPSMSVANTIERLKDKPLEFTPGKLFSYSSSNYILLGHIIEKASGEQYETFVRRHIFEPLAMNDTGYDDNRRILKNRAAGYSMRGGTLINAAYVEMSIPFAAGGLYSTVEDLYKWDQALYTNNLVSKQSLDAMFTPYKGGYGYGWYIGEQFNRRFISHSGWIDGFHAFIGRFPDDKLTVIVLSNLDSAPVSTIARALAAIDLGIENYTLKERRIVEVDPKTFDTYLGKYELAPNFIITITKEGDKLIGQTDGRPKVELHPESGSQFFVKEYDAQIVFVKDPQGKVTHSVVSINGRTAEAKKIK